VLTETLQNDAGINPRTDAWQAGYIQAVKDFLLVRLDDIEEA